MNPLGKLWAALWRKSRSVSFTLTDGQIVRGELAGPTAAGRVVNEQSAMSIAATWACVRILAETIAALPWALHRKNASGNSERADDHPLQDVLLSPNSEMTSSEFREALMVNLCLNGNAYSLIERSGSRVVALFPLRSMNVRPVRKQGSNTKLAIPEGETFFKVSDRGKTDDFPRERVWHIKTFGHDGLVGLSPIGAAREAMGAALAGEEFANRFFSQGGMPAGTVSYPGWLTEVQRAEARKHLQELVGGLGKAHQFAMFEGGVKPEPWEAMPLEDMQFLGLRKFSVNEICRLYRVPPHMVGDLDRATFSNIEHQSLEFVQHTILPYLTRFESSVAKWLLPVGDRARHFLKFNVEGLLRADSAGRASFYSSALQNGWMNRNEVRAKENLNRVDDLDAYTVQVNLTPVQELARALRGDSADKAIENDDLKWSASCERGNKAIEGLTATLKMLAVQRKRLILDEKGDPVGIEPWPEETDRAH